jgi:hypothetical protein
MCEQVVGSIRELFPFHLLKELLKAKKDFGLVTDVGDMF